MKTILSMIMTAAILLSALTACAARGSKNRVEEARVTPTAAPSATLAPGTAAAEKDGKTHDNSLGDAIGDAARDAGNAAGRVAEGAGNAVGNAVQGVGNAVDDMADDAANAADRANNGGGKVNDTDGKIGNGR